MMTLTIEIPALDRLCDILEERQRGTIIKGLKDEIVARLKEAAEGGAPKPKFEEVTPAEDHPWKDEAKAQNEATSSVTADAAPPSPEGKAQVATLADVQQACARLRDAGKMAEVKGLFPEFGIKKLSDLKGQDQLAAFAERLKKLEG